VCGKVYPSYQALGGHKTSHRKPPPTPTAPPAPTPQAASAGDEPAAPVVAGAHAEEKVHQCSLCLRTFPSGQALGGHKRLHYEGGGGAAAGADGGKADKDASKTKANAAQQATPVLRDFDLNLPAAAAAAAATAATVEEPDSALPEAKRARTMTTTMLLVI
jgi:hypothetical protein